MTTSRAKQSPEDRLHRLSDCRCPVHGGGMGQISPWFDDVEGDYALAECSRKDCHIIVKGYDSDEVWGHWNDGRPIYGLRAKLLPEWEYLLEPGGDDKADIDACWAANAHYKQIASGALTAKVAESDPGQEEAVGFPAVAEDVLKSPPPEKWYAGRELRPMVLPSGKPNKKKSKK